MARRAKEGEEVRDRHVQLLFKPSVFDAVHYIAKRNKVSFNHMVENILVAYITRYQELNPDPTKPADSDGQ